MRVIAGSARSLPLKTVEGLDTRPTTDRIKETLFNMIHNEVPGCRFLDLFSGSGAIGIEALSRGAASCVFVDNSRKAASCIQENLKFTRLGDRAEVLQADMRSAIARVRNREPFDVIFMDPPYLKDLEREALELLLNAPCVTEETLFIVEVSLKTDLSWLEESGYELIKNKRYKTNAHLFLRKQ
ncbi:MAG: 16S rRNA (guanine(966)-N(2))-methyltransferase RsmD [Lachnospiraceae bacterium]|nr:16S rRNA (guanine(966)-N(2))-methyltransferase RsmD [Lachnospiraceae bacterium]